jgi:deoxyribonucleoside regulator
MEIEKQRQLMAEVALYYYEKKYTQQKVADILGLSRQTVSKLLIEAENEGIVEIKIHNPETERRALACEICQKFGIKGASVCGISRSDEEMTRLLIVRHAAEYLLPIIEKGGLNIAFSWGRTLLAFVNELPSIRTSGNVIFPLLGATDWEAAYFTPNELARSLAEKTGSAIKYAWFPYYPENKRECEFFKTTTYYNNMQNLWKNIDLAIVGIGNSKTAENLLSSAYPHELIGAANSGVVGDIATHFYKINGEVIPADGETLCASAENLRSAKQVVAIAGGPDKVKAIAGALRTGIVTHLITDEITARGVLKLAK